jgi:3-hydroxyacyl-[acyl-carrier-protein] dehydratase
MPPTPIIDPRDIPRDVIADYDEICRINPQRHEMVQLTAITLLDGEQKCIAGYKDVRADEFWVRGHIPGFPLLPGVIMCEAAAQLCAFYTEHFRLSKGDFVGFGGMDQVRFRGPVRPGQRLWLVGRTDKHSSRKMVFEIQGFVDEVMVFHGQFIGVPLSIKQETP